jgi:hypothetical protein
MSHQRASNCLNAPPSVIRFPHDRSGASCDRESDRPGTPRDHPKIVDLHNYEQALRIDTKIYNWNTLNQKVFKKIGATIDAATITSIANSQPGAIDRFLCQIRDLVTSRQSTPGPPAKGKPVAKKEKPPLPVAKPMGDEDRELLISQIRESHRQTELIRALEAKEAKLMELMRVKDAKIVKLMAKREAAK